MFEKLRYNWNIAGVTTCVNIMNKSLAMRDIEKHYCYTKRGVLYATKAMGFSEKNFPQNKAYLSELVQALTKILICYEAIFNKGFQESKHTQNCLESRTSPYSFTSNN